MGAAEATLGYRLRQYHVGLVCWVGGAVGAVDEITRLEQAIGHVAGKAVCAAHPVFLPRDESAETPARPAPRIPYAAGRASR